MKSKISVFVLTRFILDLLAPSPLVELAGPPRLSRRRRAGRLAA